MRSIDEIRTGPVRLGSPPLTLSGDLLVPDPAHSVVIFAHGSGKNRGEPPDALLADAFAARGIATLRFDMLTADEEEAENGARHLRFDHALLAGRLVEAIDWVRSSDVTGDWRVGLLGAGTGAAAALIAAARRPQTVSALVSRGGRPDLAMQLLGQVICPILLIVGEEDEVTLEHNKRACDRLRAPIKHLDVIPGAGHAFAEPGAMEAVAGLASDWFVEHLSG